MQETLTKNLNKKLHDKSLYHYVFRNKIVTVLFIE
jgi:hypothetical protein